MRRLNAADTLLAAIRQGAVTAADIDALASSLATFYRNQPWLPLSADDYRAQIERHARTNLTELLSDEERFLPHEVRRVLSAQLIYLAFIPAILTLALRQGAWSMATATFDPSMFISRLHRSSSTASNSMPSFAKLTCWTSLRSWNRSASDCKRRKLALPSGRNAWPFGRPGSGRARRVL